MLVDRRGGILGASRLAGLQLMKGMRGKSSIEEGDAKKGVLHSKCKQTSVERAKQQKQGKEGDIVAYLLPRAKVPLISKHKQIKTSNTQSWFYSNYHTDLTAHRGYTTHPTLGVLGLSSRALCLMQSSEFSSGVATSLVVVR